MQIAKIVGNPATLKRNTIYWNTNTNMDGNTNTLLTLCTRSHVNELSDEEEVALAFTWFLTFPSDETLFKFGSLSQSLLIQSPDYRLPVSTCHYVHRSNADMYRTKKSNKNQTWNILDTDKVKLSQRLQVKCRYLDTEQRNQLFPPPLPSLPALLLK